MHLEGVELVGEGAACFPLRRSPKQQPGYWEESPAIVSICGIMSLARGAAGWSGQL